MRRILVPIDFSPVTEAVLAEVRVLASKLGCSVTLLHVAPPDPDFVGYEPGPQCVRDDVAQEFREDHRKIQDLAQTLRDQGNDVKGLLVQGPTTGTILEVADREEVDWIVLGSHGHGGLMDLLLGSVSESVVKQACRPVLIVPSRSRAS